MSKKGRITPNGVILEKHEYKTVVFLTGLGKNVELIPKSNKKGVHTPDIIMDGIEWEMKSPKGQGRWLIENTLRTALTQSPYIIIDLDRIKIHQTKCLQELEKQFMKFRAIKKLKVITKTKKVIDFEK